jgi:hypothetical protein
MGALLLVACSRCKTPRLAKRGAKTASCGQCGRSIDLVHARILFESDSLEEAQDALGRANARRAGREGEYGSSAPLPPVVRSREDSARNVARTSPAALRIESVARALGTFTSEELLASVASARQDPRFRAASEKAVGAFLASSRVVRLGDDRWRLVE